jgi:hypothetical protein
MNCLVYVKHSKECVFGGHLISMNILLRKENIFCTLLKSGREFMPIHRF